MVHRAYRNQTEIIMDELEVGIVDLGDAKEVTKGQVIGEDQESLPDFPRQWD